MTNRLATIIKNNGGHIHTNHPITALTHVRTTNEPVLLNTTRQVA